MYTVTVQFTIDSHSATHAEALIRNYLYGKGVTEKRTVYLTPDSDGKPRTEERYGYLEIRAQSDK